MRIWRPLGVLLVVGCANSHLGVSGPDADAPPPAADGGPGDSGGTGSDGCLARTSGAQVDEWLNTYLSGLCERFDRCGIEPEAFCAATRRNGIRSELPSRQQVESGEVAFDDDAAAECLTWLARSDCADPLDTGLGIRSGDGFASCLGVFRRRCRANPGDPCELVAGCGPGMMCPLRPNECGAATCETMVSLGQPCASAFCDPDTSPTSAILCSSEPGDGEPRCLAVEHMEPAGSGEACGLVEVDDLVARVRPCAGLRECLLEAGRMRRCSDPPGEPGEPCNELIAVRCAPGSECSEGLCVRRDYALSSVGATCVSGGACDAQAGLGCRDGTCTRSATRKAPPASSPPVLPRDSASTRASATLVPVAVRPLPRSTSGAAVIETTTARPDAVVEIRFSSRVWIALAVTRFGPLVLRARSRGPTPRGSAQVQVGGWPRRASLKPLVPAAATAECERRVQESGA